MKGLKIFYLILFIFLFLIIFLVGCSKNVVTETSSQVSSTNFSEVSSVSPEEELQNILNEYLGDSSSIDLPMDVWD